MKKVAEKRKDIVFYLKLYPCKSYKDSYRKSKSIICSNSTKMLEDSFERKQIPNTECKSSEIEDNIRLADWLRIDSAPALVFPDCRLEKGLRSAERIIDIIDGRY
jgi:hypothetical protein